VKQAYGSGDGSVWCRSVFTYLYVDIVGWGGAFSGVWAAYFATPLTLSLNLFPSGSTWITSLAARIVAFTETAAPGALKIVPFGEA